MSSAEMSNLLQSFLLLTCTLIAIQPISGVIRDTMNTGQTIRDGETMVSSGGMFELGFFSPGNSTNRYVGMWYKNISVRTVVWVANRRVPLPNKSGVLRVTDQGILLLINDTNGSNIWSSNTSRIAKNPVAQLLDSGNLVVREATDDNAENYLWQSFDYPTDTYLPGMKFGRDFVTGINRGLSSWKNNDDPAPGNYTYFLDPTGYPQVFISKNGAEHVRTGPWNGIRFSGRTNTVQDPTFRMSFVMNENEVYYQEVAIDRSVISRSTFGQGGEVLRLTWIGRTQEWLLYNILPADNCDTYNLCGAYGTCNIANSPACGCLNKFVPKDPQTWVAADWSRGCVRRTNLSCQGDVFLKYSGIKLPESRHTRQNESLSLEECRAECLRNCSCTAYTQLDLSKPLSGCLFWFEDLADIRQLSQDGQDIYIRMAASELEAQGNKPRILIGSLTSGIGIVLLALGFFLYIRKRKNESQIKKQGIYSGSNQEDSDLRLFKYSDILKATNYFSEDNKLGEGGFGPVFKGTTDSGQEIAVKLSSSTSTQGTDEFKNEVIFISKLQHRNLVRLLGCCIHGEENMLIYEYMPHKSLDCVLFNQTRMVLDWPKRFQIINGIARGLVYLHHDSRLRIIHRDLKASNILLDSDMNPKISDFGTARSFGGNEVAAKTRRVIGTYGYMSPEYAVDGLFSIKSDVFSFGVLILEIVCGKRNRGFSHNNHHLNLLGHAWTLHKEERTMELVDPSVVETLDLSEVLRSIHVGLLCVQRKPEDRPTMSSVVLMLGNEGALPSANEPGFFTEREVSIQGSNSTINSTNEITITMPEGR